MEKFLLTCFLAFLCLYGSATIAQVADSPTDGAGLVDKVSGPHRGGETRPDTFSFDEFGLINRYQDTGAGEEASSLCPAPVTVSDQLVVANFTPFSEFSLVDDSTSLGDEFTILSAPYDSLRIGDKIPEGIEFSSVLRYDGDKLRLDDFKGQFLILEFWAPTCTGSIASLPVMDKINQKYGDKVQVVPLTIFSEDKLEETLERYKSLNAIEMPMVADASKLRAYFPHSTIPHVVIVDPEGVVVAITGMEDMTEQNLDLLLNNGISAFRVKEDLEIPLDRNERLISESHHVPNKNIWFQSALTGYIPDVNGSLIQRYEDFSHIRIVNTALYYHYQLAYSERSRTDYFGTNRIEMVGFGPEEMSTKKSGADYREWMEEGGHVYGYELIAPPTSDPFELMRADLRRFFPHITASVVTKKKMVYALVQQPGKSFPLSSVEERNYETSPMGVEMTHYPLQGFVYHLNVVFFRASPYPVINLTGIDYPIDLKLDAQLASFESLRQALRQNGLDLIEREEEIPVLVLEKNSNSKDATP